MSTWSIDGAAWREGSNNGTIVDGDGSLTLIQGVSRGVWEGPATIGAGDRFVASLNADPFPVGAGVRLSVRRDDGDEWIELLVLGASADLPRGAEASGAGWAVEGDLLRLETPMLLAARLEVEAGELGGRPCVRRLAVASWFASHAAELPPREAPPERSTVWGTELAVPERSQRGLPGDLPDRACSPTSLAMALAFHGCDLPTEELAERVRDRASGIYGNWSLNVAAAGALGFEAEVARMFGIAELEAEVAAGRPVVISHRYAAGELSDTPLPETKGHLIVVAGFTDTGDVIVRDPAADPRQGEAVRRVYARSEVERTWLTKEPAGIAYRVTPRPDRQAGSS